MTSTPALGTLIAVAGTDDVASAYAATYPHPPWSRWCWHRSF